MDFSNFALTSVGPAWLAALGAMIITTICESARPKPADGEKREGGFLIALAAIATLVTPFLLFIHGFWSMAEFSDIEATPQNFINVVLARRVILAALLAFLIAITVAAGAVGWIIRASAPGFGRTEYTEAIVFPCPFCL